MIALNASHYYGVLTFYLSKVMTQNLTMGILICLLYVNIC